MPAACHSILFVTPEATPFAKTGGLADVAGALPVALGRLGHRVTVVLPRYRLTAAGRPIGRVSIAIGPDHFTAGLGEHEVADGVRVIAVDCPELYDREHLYGSGAGDYADNARRFAFLSRAALEVVVVTGRRPDVIHAHDWQTGLTPVYLKTAYAGHQLLSGVPAVFTIHNLAYQGLFPQEWLAALDLPGELFTADGVEFWGRVSFLKAGIRFSEIVTTVSARYAREIQTEELGCGFEGILASRAETLVGIPNGIDTTVWNPATDAFLPVRYSAAELDGKAATKRALLGSLGLAIDDASMARPVIGMVSRMVDQKGFDLLGESAARLLSLPVTMVLLGSGDPRYEREWMDRAAAHPDRVGVRIGFDDRLAHLVIAGADLFLMPSRFEPCGLSQMYALRYGTVPVVRATGGLDDTVTDWNPRTHTGTGFKFEDYTPDALLAALERALATYAQPSAWRVLQVAAMQGEFSWDTSALEYRAGVPIGRCGLPAGQQPRPGSGRPTRSETRWLPAESS